MSVDNPVASRAGRVRLARRGGRSGVVCIGELSLVGVGG